jgi:hypothetical protein
LAQVAQTLRQYGPKLIVFEANSRKGGMNLRMKAVHSSHYLSEGDTPNIDINNTYSILQKIIIHSGTRIRLFFAFC